MNAESPRQRKDMNMTTSFKERPYTIETEELDTAKIGDGATVNCYSDRQACTIVKRTENKIWVQRDKATLLNGFKSGEEDALKFSPGGFCGHASGTQRYTYEPNPAASVVCYSRREWTNDYDRKTYVRYIRVGQARKGGESISSGRHEHYDYNF